MSSPRPALLGSSSTQASAECAHCGEPVAPRAGRFCCAGCQTAYALLHEHGLEEWYALAERDGRSVSSAGGTFEAFDHSAFHELYVHRTADGWSTVDLYLEGVHCSACVWLVERLPVALPGVLSAELDMRRSLATLVWDPAALPLSELARFLDRVGYRPHAFRGATREVRRRQEDRSLILRIGVAGALAVNVMLLALAQYAGWFSGIDAGAAQFFRWWSLALTVPAVLGPGRTFFVGAWAALRAGVVHMDVPIALALSAGLLRGAWNTWQGAGPIYFDGVTFLIFLLLCGRGVQQFAQRRASDATELLGTLAPSVARVVQADGSLEETPVAALLPGMRIEVRAGDAIAADGVVLAGRSELDLSLLTGESRPTPVREGDAVFAGTVNLAATLRLHVTASGESSRLGQLLHQVEEGARRRAPMVQLADRLAGRFVLVVLVAAAATLAYWWRVDPTLAIDHAIAVLIVTCPCALALATPLAVQAAVGQAARRGILIRNGEALERMATPAALLLDKTGTLTDGQLRLQHWAGEDELRPLVLALEADAVHPVARAFRDAWPTTCPAVATTVQTQLGGGVRGSAGGRDVVVGSPTFVGNLVEVTAADTTAVAAIAREGLTPILVAVDGMVRGLAGFADAVRADALPALTRLRALGYVPSIISGDHPAVVQRAARLLAIDEAHAHGGVTPEQKQMQVTAAKQDGPVVMVGDGVNDAAALTAADIGIGVRGGAEACLAVADVHLAAPGLTPLVELAEGARRTMRLIRVLLVLSLCYNAVASVLAMTGRIDPLIAAILMPGTSIINIVAAWRVRTFRAVST